MPVMFTPDGDQPDAASLDSLGETLAALADRTAHDGPWRSGAFTALAKFGLLAGFVPRDCGGTGAAEQGLVAALVVIAERCLTTALALTQWAAAVRIIIGATADVRATLLPPLARGDTRTTVGISHLTTSRRHLGTPALTASRDGAAWRLNGFCPWVTGADSSGTIVTGAATEDGGQMFFVVPTDATGLTVDPPMTMLALSGSRTAAVHFAGVRPAHAIAPAGGGPRTGGLATTALAVGAARASTAAIAREAQARPGLAPIAAEFTAEIAGLMARLAAGAREGIEPEQRDQLRAAANGLVVRAAQAALTASKGAGFLAGHPVERLVRESLFFLVWSCPQAVSDAVLCELAGVD
ncbi:MAG: acyl-CoA/acyl-ACP dehydrogenase [Planctomycetia bacterium]|nr:acyl-CoA/acyl-ACP dehydrogenase [Planctomycetia bacterium]